MIGRGTLIAYAGQTITLSGTGKLIVNHGALLLGAGTLIAKANESSKATITGTGLLLATATEAPRGIAELHAFTSIGGDHNYALSKQSLKAFYSYGDNEYVPPSPDGGIAYLIPFSSWGFAAGASGEGQGSLQAFQSRGGDYNYSIGSGSLKPFRSFGFWEDAQKMTMMSYGRIFSETNINLELLLVFTSTGTLSSSFTGTRVIIQEMLSTLVASDSFSFLLTYKFDLISSIIGSDIILAQVGNKPVFDSTARVWAVNLDTEASSQYDNYGFNSLFTDEQTGIDYGITDDGIYSIDSDTDSGEDIEFLIDTGRTNYGSRKQKKSYAVYIGASSTGDVFLKLDIDGVVKIYSADVSPVMKPNRVGLSHRHTGTYWNLVLTGTTSEISDIEFTLLPRGRRTNG